MNEHENATEQAVNVDPLVMPDKCTYCHGNRWLSPLGFGVKKSKYSDGEPCSHVGCLNHVSHPCEGCGRIGGISNQEV